MHRSQPDGSLLHLYLLDRQFSQHLMIRLLVLFLEAPFNAGPQSECLILGIFVDEEVKDGEHEGEKIEDYKT